MTRDGTRSAKALGTILAKIATYGLGLIASIVVARVLGPEGRGSYFVIVTVAATAMSLGHLSIEQANVYLWGRERDRRQLAANSVAIGLAAGLLAGALAWLVVRLLGPDRVPVAGYGLLAVALAAVPAGMLALYVSILVVLDDRIGRVNLSRLLAALLQTAALIALAVAGRLDVAWVVWIWAATTALPLVVVLLGFGARPRHLSARLAGEAMGVGLRYHLGMSAVFLLFRVDVFLLNAMVTRAEVGLYSLAVTLAELTYLITDSLAQVALPVQSSGPLDESGRFTARAARTNLIVALTTMAGIGLFGPLFVPLLFGSEFSGSMRAVYALAPGVIALATMRPAGGFLIRLNRPMLVSAASWAALAINVALNLVLIPALGIVGAGVASSVAYVLLAAFYLTWLSRAAALPPRELIPRISDLYGPVSALLSRLPRWSA